jgi:hypothetical protein
MIARVLAIDPKTLRRHFREELDTRMIKANARVAESLFRTALKGGREGTTAAIFWLKALAGWAEYRPPRERPLGKKEAALLAAETAGARTGWEDLLDALDGFPALRS